MTLTRYDSTEFNFKILLSKGIEIPVYGFVNGDKITFDQTGLRFHLQATSGCVDGLLDSLGLIVSIKLETSNKEFKKLVNLFDELQGTLILEKGSLVSSNIPELSFKIKWIA